MSSNASQSDSFSLPSAGGMVNLLNDAKSKSKNFDSGELREHNLSNFPSLTGVANQRSDPKYNLSASSSTNTLNIPPLTTHRSESASSDSSAPRSPFSSNPSGGESHGSSMTSIIPSTDSSRDESLESGKASARASAEEDESEENNSKTLQNARLNRNQRTNTSYSSSPSEEEEEGDKTHPTTDYHQNNNLKRRRDSDSREDETVQSRKVSMNRMLDAPRLAKSPPPIRGSDNHNTHHHPHHSVSTNRHGYENQSRERARSSSFNQNRTSQDVPMNMHRATNSAYGGYGGQNQLDENEGENNAEQYGRDAYGRRRASTGESSGSSKAPVLQNGRKASSGSQMIGGKKRYPCSFPGCDKTFSTSGHAARHNRIHTGSKPYRCTFPGCNASFSRQDNSLQHYRTHVLHPKSRSGGTVNLDASQIDSVALDNELSNLDPEMVATVQMGRKALEEGTAIAVVQEFIDGNGRRAEAVQRMVGQPKHGRRGSNATSGSATHQWDSEKGMGQHMGSSNGQHRRRISAPGYDRSPYDRGMNGHGNMDTWQMSDSHQSQWAEYPHGHHPAYPNDAGYYHHHHHEAPPHLRHQYPNANYPPPPHDPYRHGDGMASYPQSYGNGEGYNLPHPPNGHQPGYRPSFEAPHSPTQIISPRSGDPRYQTNERQRQHGRERHNSDNVGMHSPSFFKGAPPPPPHSAHSTQFAPHHHQSASFSSKQDRGFSVHSSGNQEFNGGHRRSVSGANTFHPAMPMSGYGRPYAGMQTSNATAEPIDAPSPSFSIRSFRSEGPYNDNPMTKEKDNRNANALSMLSNAAAPLPPARTNKIILPSPTSSTRKSNATAEMHLPLPKALSKVPCSSDRSTNALTPTPLTPSFIGEEGKLTGKPIHSAQSGVDRRSNYSYA